jgi:hypothetical protein
VLFDWERFCRGAPARDLAPLLPGLGTAEIYAELARTYLDAADRPATAVGVADLARQIGLAKAWHVVELLSGVGGRGERADPLVAWLREAVPAWLRSLGSTV